ncbi:hypothetical protein XANCAGTX0491_009791 [Xanthoria calcicola]
MPLSSLVLSCLRSFGELVREIEASQYGYEDQVPAASWIDELGRLRIWAGNVGAHRNGPSSLEFRLRDASHILDEVTRLLTDLERLLNEAQEYISAEYHEEDETSSDDSLDEDPVTELQALFGELVMIIQCLYKLAMLIRNPAQHDFLAESYRTDTVAFEPFDKQHVCNKFPLADERLILRLSKALTRRRGYLKYRARHSMKLARGLVHVQESGREDAASISETMASIIQLQPVEHTDNSSQSGMSQTSYANSILEGGIITVPPPPQGSLGGGPFECPYCHFIIQIATTQSWHRHVFTDLRPYTCVFQQCRTPDKLYSSRREWFGHMHGTHNTTEILCPLCKLVLGTAKQFEPHLARHMEELALFVLPRDGNEDQGEEGIPDDLALSVSDAEQHGPPGGINEWVEHTNELTESTQSFGNPPSDRLTATTASYGLSSLSNNEDQDAKRVLDQSSKSGGESSEDYDFGPSSTADSIEKKQYIRFKDAVGRKFAFPFTLCKTWDNMENLIRQAFLHVKVLDEHVREGQYDLVGPNGQIILPSVWDTIIQPGWLITMHMWPIPKNVIHEPEEEEEEEEEEEPGMPYPFDWWSGSPFW